MNAVVRALVDHLGDVLVASNGNEYRFCCPYEHFDSAGRETPDTKYRLYVNATKQKWFCQRCARGGSVKFLLSKMNVEVADTALTRWDRVIADLRGIALPEPNTAVPPPSPAYPCEVYEVRPKTEAHRYLLQRGLRPSDIPFYSIVAGTGYWQDRVFVPTFGADGELAYWNARLFRGDHPAKYLNPKVPKSHLVFNIANVGDTAIICEGVFSAIGAGRSATATFGKYMSPLQLRTLAATGARRFVFAVESDARKISHANARKLSSLVGSDREVLIAHLPAGEDPISLDEVEWGMLLEEAKPLQFALMEVPRE